MRNCIISAVLNLVLNAIFIPKWGLYAAAATTAISEIACFCLAIPHIEKEVKLGNFIKLAGAPVLGCILMTVCSFLLKLVVNDLVSRTIIIMLSCALIYFIILILFKNELAMNFINLIKKKIVRK